MIGINKQLKERKLAAARTNARRASAPSVYLHSGNSGHGGHGNLGGPPFVGPEVDADHTAFSLYTTGEECLTAPLATGGDNRAPAMASTGSQGLAVRSVSAPGSYGVVANGLATEQGDASHYLTPKGIAAGRQQQQMAAGVRGTLAPAATDSGQSSAATADRIGHPTRDSAEQDAAAHIFVESDV